VSIVELGPRRFEAVLAMRQAHGFAHGKSDFFFVVALKPEPGQMVGLHMPVHVAAWTLIIVL
jgi:hypothetical protein